MSEAQSRPYEIGLVMAGAVSAGAYTAGVVDFMLEALETWEHKKRAQDPEAPPHQVKIKVLTGASAGSITAAVLSSSIRSQDYPGKKPTPLYQTWVDLVNIEGLLGNSDLDEGKSVLSLLNSEFLEGIADRVLAQAWTRADWPSYFSDPLELYFTVTNLRGMPYGIQFAEDGASGEYAMKQHADYMHFYLSPSDDVAQYPLGALRLGGSADRDKLEGNWGVLRRSALASGAFPVGLAAQPLQRSGTWAYDLRRWPFPNEHADDPEAPCVEYRPVVLSWPEDVKSVKDSWNYEFISVDGGVCNNEPFEIARSCLAGEGGRNPRGAREAHRCVLMVDPFPDANSYLKDYPTEKQRTLLNVIPNLFSAMISQLRFKTQELELALDPNTFSRWLVAPRRYERKDGKEVQASAAIACGGLGGFSGFFSRAFREHDYQLGRRNAQKFLRDTFVLQEDNPVFDAWKDETSKTDHRINRDGVSYLPVIPLLGDCGSSIEPEPVWPKGAMTKDHFDTLTERMMERADRLVRNLSAEFIKSGWERMLVNVGWTALKWRRKFLGETMVDPIVNVIRKDLEERGLD